ncbi:hypothetical protein Tc00.1047053506451.35 [Trypanosoma cruzi]|uniref:Uncharacterized protein n=1 Tax=Trypanosoma cruzi (strain CL Brener) TaxID=353153 RepID=Q4D6L9_TRYCC|nr:hypothetical protein Tc00.1047053506451.35 [Trypanosoma cruzi]EAN88173.1 hypothetical protein Tc00.1047053506451.35 [Trypanosoma cruzi]|eukprot:XP_810024.1 hypothetical protein [Trypanosoma cruzi strain CL Brener]
MAGNFVAASWTDEGSLARVAGVVAAVFLPFPWGCGDELGEMVVDVFSSCMVDGCWRCVPSLRGCRLVVCELCGWACCLSSCCLLSLAVSAALRPPPSCSIPFPSVSRIGSLTPATPLRVMMTAMMTMVTVRRRVVCAVLVLAPLYCCCNSVDVTAAGSPGHVSGDADAVVVPVDVSCAQSDGSLSYRVRACVYGRGSGVLLPVPRLSVRITLSVALMCACIAGMASWVLCAMWPMRCTHVATVLPAVQRRRKRPPLPSR